MNKPEDMQHAEQQRRHVKNICDPLLRAEILGYILNCPLSIYLKVARKEF
jgi:hypothetical protein